MRKIILGLVATAAIAATAVIGTARANAYTANADGTISVSKGEVQTALGWNNGDFDANVGKARTSSSSSLASGSTWTTRWSA